MFFNDLHKRLSTITIDQTTFNDVSLIDINRLIIENDVYDKTYTVVKNVDVTLNDNSIVKKDIKE